MPSFFYSSQKKKKKKVAITIPLYIQENQGLEK